MKISPTKAELDVLLALYFHRKRVGDSPVTMAELVLSYPGKVLSGVRLSLHAKGLAEAIEGKRMRLTPVGYAFAVGRVT